MLLKDFQLSSSGSYSLTLVDGRGTILASTTARRRTITASAGISSSISNISARGDRVYYLDGDADLRYLRTDGRSGAVRRITVPAGWEAAFSVSPDSTRIAVSLIDFRAAPFSTTLYVEDLGDGGHHVDLFSGVAKEWPVGWHHGSLIVGIGPNGYPQNMYDGFEPPSAFHVVDPSTGLRNVALCEAPSDYGADGSLPSSAGFVCHGSGGSTVYNWSGVSPPVPQAPDCPLGGPVLADGIAVAVPNCNGRLTIIRLSGDRTPTAGGDGRARAWLDADHLLVEAAGRLSDAGHNPPVSVLEVSSGKLTPLPAGYFVGGVVPSTL